MNPEIKKRYEIKGYTSAIMKRLKDIFSSPNEFNYKFTKRDVDKGVGTPKDLRTRDKRLEALKKLGFIREIEGGFVFSKIQIWRKDINENENEIALEVEKYIIGTEPKKEEKRTICISGEIEKSNAREPDTNHEKIKTSNIEQEWLKKGITFIFENSIF